MYLGVIHWSEAYLVMNCSKKESNVYALSCTHLSRLHYYPSKLTPHAFLDDGRFFSSIELCHPSCVSVIFKIRLGMNRWKLHLLAEPSGEAYLVRNENEVAMKSELFRSFLHLWCFMSLVRALIQAIPSVFSLFSNFVGFSVVSNPLDSLFMKQKLSRWVGEYLLALSIGDGVVWFIRANCVANECFGKMRQKYWVW